MLKLSDYYQECNQTDSSYHPEGETEEEQSKITQQPSKDSKNSREVYRDKSEGEISVYSIFPQSIGGDQNLSRKKKSKK